MQILFTACYQMDFFIDLKINTLSSWLENDSIRIFSLKNDPEIKLVFTFYLAGLDLVSYLDIIHTCLSIYVQGTLQILEILMA